MLFKLANAVLSASNIYILQGSLVHPQNNANISCRIATTFFRKIGFALKINQRLLRLIFFSVKLFALSCFN
jgi:hypothetical protein